MSNLPFTHHLIAAVPTHERAVSMAQRRAVVTGKRHAIRKSRSFGDWIVWEAL